MPTPLSIWHQLKNRVLGSSATDSVEKPWLTRKEWSSPHIKSGAQTQVWIAWGFAIFWNAIAFPAGIATLDEVLAGDREALIVMLFPLVGLLLLLWPITATRRYWRFGKTPLSMDPYPGAIGGQVGGSLVVPLPYDPQLNFQVTLSCAYSYMTGSGKDRKRKERVVWQSEGFAYTRSHGGKTRVETLFNVDEQLPASDFKNHSSYHLWRLHVEAKLPGADFVRSFELPVFPTGEQARQLRDLSTEHASASEARMQAIEHVLDLRQIPGGVELYYPAFRHPGGKLVGIVVGLVFVAVGIVVGYQGGPIAFPIIFPLLGAGVALVCAYSLLVSLRVRLDNQQLHTEKRILGRRVGGKTISRSDVRCLKLQKGHSASNGRKLTQYFKLQALTHSGDTVDVGYNLAGREVAEQAMESLSLLTGVPVEDVSGGKALA